MAKSMSCRQVTLNVTTALRPRRCETLHSPRVVVPQTHCCTRREALQAIMLVASGSIVGPVQASNEIPAGAWKSRRVTKTVRDASILLTLHGSLFKHKQHLFWKL